MKFIPIILIIGTIIFLLRVFRPQITRFLTRLQVKIRMQSLRSAINEADENKSKTGRKNIVVPTHDGFFEPVQKRKMKAASNLTKNKNNAKHTPGRLKFMKKKQRLFQPERIKEIEDKSLYATN